MGKSNWDEEDFRACWYYSVNDGLGFVSIGWGEVGDLLRFNEDLKDLRSTVIEVAKRKKWPTRAGELEWKVPASITYDVTTLSNFAGWTNAKNPMEKGDGVIAYNEKCVYAIGEVKGDYVFQKDLPWFQHTREVQWFKYLKTPPRLTKNDSLIVRSLGRPPTLLPITKKAVVKAVWKLDQWN